MSDTFRKESRKDWHANGDRIPTDEEFKFACLQRIADATELMAKNHVQMERDLKWAMGRNEWLKKDNERLARSNAALRGHIKRLKAKVDK